MCLAVCLFPLVANRAFSLNFYSMHYSCSTTIATVQQRTFGKYKKISLSTSVCLMKTHQEQHHLSLPLETFTIISAYASGLLDKLTQVRNEVFIVLEKLFFFGGHAELKAWSRKIRIYAGKYSCLHTFFSTIERIEMPLLINKKAINQLIAMIININIV